jgi:hypothetical protein
MFARRQIDDAMFAAARKYQSIHDQAKSVDHIHTVDTTMTQISGAQSVAYENAARALDAGKELRRIEVALAKHVGEVGLALTRDVLGLGLTIEAAAAERGDKDKARVGWWGGMFRRSLRHLAEISGYAVTHAYENRQREQTRERKREKRQAEDGSKESKEPGPALVKGWPGDGLAVPGGRVILGDTGVNGRGYS